MPRHVSFSLSVSFSLPPSLCLSLPFFPPPPPSPVLAHRPHRTLRPSSCTESVPHTTFAYVYCRHTSVYTHLYASACMHMRTYTRAKCIPRCFRSLCVPSFDPSSSSSSSSFPSFRSFFPPVRSTHGLPTYVCPDLKIVRLVPSRSP